SKVQQSRPGCLRPVAAPAATIPGVLVTVPLDASTIYAYVAVGTSATVGRTTVAVSVGNITGGISIEVTGGGTTVALGNITGGISIEMTGSITMKITVPVSALATLGSADSRAGLRGTTGGTTLPFALPTAAVPGPSSQLPVVSSALDGSGPVSERVPPSLR
ncbi:unnamed protein product, partial [Tilletia laevis]